ncbi:hypothetical protein [Mesorhizobium sp. L-8-3]|uniref:hypothetical protein n=1 Tax=Mesorhizobium sp. L-8-3 TaxID=2744522 RepID=UPI001925C520|nr:hypothetical protein [Mesorhizobium sp. L-8-3]BCH24287.1 hypothetical protein MesoLjLb_40720 [Mesorhizobium sp. L-8-3]
MKPILVVACTLLSLQGSQSAAYARGFCNVDHYGKDENREEARSAAAQFYGGAAKLMQAFAAFELDSNDDVYRNGKEAAEVFRRSSGTYAKAKALFEENPGNNVTTFGDLNPDAIAAMAGANQDALAVLHAGQVSPGMLLARCGEEAEEVAAAVERFVSKSTEELRSEDFSSVLGQLSEAFRFGSVISATFAYASGERPEQKQPQ